MPIAFGYLDYKTKIIGITEGIVPCGDIEKDMLVIRRFYADVQGKYPDRVSDMALRSEIE